MGNILEHRDKPSKTNNTNNSISNAEKLKQIALENIKKTHNKDVKKLLQETLNVSTNKPHLFDDCLVRDDGIIITFF